MKLISVKQQEIQFGPKGQPVRIQKGIIIKPIEDGIALMKPLIGTAFRRVEARPHYIFDGTVFKTARRTEKEVAMEEKQEKMEKGDPIHCQYGCGNQARFPENDPVRCEPYAQQCPVKRDQAKALQKRRHLEKKGAHKVEVVQPEEGGFAEISDNAIE